MKKLKIGGHYFNVVVKKIPERDNELANTDYNTATITIDRETIIKSVRESTLLHEIIHACNSTFGSAGKEIEHALLDSLAEQIYQVLKDNNLLNQKQWDFYLE